MPRPSLLIISQVYVPDPASVGQHLHDAAAEVAARGYPVRVLTSARGYETPELRFPRREMRDGVEVVRFGLSSFGKRSILVRLIAQMVFLIQALLHGLAMERPGAILVSTVPPMCAAAGLLLSIVRRVPMLYWVMDINPDQAVAMGVVSEKSLLVRIFNALNRAALGRAKTVVTLDRFMVARLAGKRDISHKLVMFPPWPHEDHLSEIPHVENRFRKKLGLQGKFIVMYSGNHSPANPLDTVLEAAEILRDRDDIRFSFIGGGNIKHEVEDAIASGRLPNAMSLPYQPMSEVKYSLSAADVHLVTLGDWGVGIVHPCKIYGAMAVARPILAVGPRPSHLCDLLDRCDFGRHVEHGDPEGAARAIVELASMTPAERAAMGRRGWRMIESEFSKAVLCGRMAGLIEDALLGRPGRSVLLPAKEAPPTRKAA